MSKYIEIEYPNPKAPAEQKYKGLNSRYPPIWIDPSEAAAMSNIWLRNSEIRSAPPWQLIFASMERNNPCLGTTSFMDANNQLHTCGFNSRGLWQLNPTNANPGMVPWTFVGPPALSTGAPVSYRTFANILYYTNGAPQLNSWDGISNSVSLASALETSTFGGSSSEPSSIGSVYLYELNDQLCLLNVSLFTAASCTNPIPGTGPTTLEANTITNFPQLLWWSANGIPNQFDPTVNTSAGFNNFLEVPDIFTGVLALGEIAYLFRSNGITEQTITGNALAPFYFNHLWASDRGIGNVYPWSIAQYGGNGFFVSTEDVYQCNVYQFTNIGGGARDAIMKDLAAATQNPVAGFIPSQAYGYIYQRYELCIPLGNFTRVYSYSIEDKNWMQQDLNGFIVTGSPNVCWR
jgi:hypothetical protein